MAAFRKISLIHISHLIADFKLLREEFSDKQVRNNHSFCAGGSKLPRLQSFSCQRRGASKSSPPESPRDECQSRETIIKLKVYVTFKGPASRRSHSWTHALPSGDITPRLLPWAPVLPLDKCRPLSWGCWTEWQLCHMSGLQDRCPSVPEHRVRSMFSCKYWLGAFLYCLSIFMRPVCTLRRGAGAKVHAELKFNLVQNDRRKW